MATRRDEVFHAFYRHVPGGVQRVTEPGVSSPDDLAAEILASGEECLLVGDGALRYSESFGGLSRVDIAEQALAYPNAASLVQVAHARAVREQFVKPWEIEPLYMRMPDVEINWSVREAR